MLNISKTAHMTIVEMPEKVVFANAENLKFQLQALIEQGHVNLALNLSKVSFVDSSGLAVLVAAYKKAQNQQGDVALVAPTDNVRMLIELTRLHQVFAIYEDLSAISVVNPS